MLRATHELNDFPSRHWSLVTDHVHVRFRRMETNRLEAFSDGVLAIIITIFLWGKQAIPALTRSKRVALAKRALQRAEHPAKHTK